MNDQQQSNLSRLALPWASIVAVACVSFAYYVFGEEEQQEVPNLLPRSLGEEESQYHQIINEEHDPLFPLSASDIYGFTFAILGLMVSTIGMVLIVRTLEMQEEIVLCSMNYFSIQILS